VAEDRDDAVVSDAHVHVWRPWNSGERLGRIEAAHAPRSECDDETAHPEELEERSALQFLRQVDVSQGRIE